MRKKRRSMIPNIITMSNMLMGFYAIIFASMGGHYLYTFAGIFVLFGSIFDALDGAIARALHVESPIGLQLDSLADGISYGIAPGIIMYMAFFSNLPEIAFGINYGMLLSPIFPICAIYRLARFNVETDERKGFLGLPSPPAGVFIASIPFIATKTDLPLLGIVQLNIPIQLIVILYIVIALLMVSKVDYNKFFSDSYRRSKPMAIAIISFLWILFFILGLYAVFIISGGYIITGIFNTAFKALKNKTNAAAI